MSILNNRSTLFCYRGGIWLTKPGHATVQHGLEQVNVCVEQHGAFSAVDRLARDAHGVYHRRGRPLGKPGDAAFERYIDTLAGAKPTPQQASRLYAETGSVAATAKALGLPVRQVRRTLITTGALTNPLIEQIVFLYDAGRGKTVAEMAEILGVSPGTVRANLPYAE